MDRRRELDSLRGLAALSVLAYHVLASNSLQLTSGLGLGPVDGAVNRLLTYSPLHVIWLGAEAVWLFFVLSGFVLTRATMRSGFSWSAYYPSRMVRLYLPVAFAVALAWLTYLVPHNLGPGMDPMWPTSYPPSNIIHDLTLVGGTSTSLGVLWSLQWEVIFSLLLPVYVLLARTRPLVTGIIAVIALGAGWVLNDPVTSFLPMFFIGVVMAQHWDRIRGAFSFLEFGRPWSHVVGATLLVVSICGLTSFFLLGPALQGTPLPPRLATLPVVLAAIALLIVLVQSWPPLRAVLSTRVFVFLGTISFSLYLVHLPIVVLFLFVLTPGPLAAVAGFVTALAVAIGFYYLVERPAHRLSRRVGAHAKAKLAPDVRTAPEHASEPASESELATSGR